MGDRCTKIRLVPLNRGRGAGFLFLYFSFGLFSKAFVPQLSQDSAASGPAGPYRDWDNQKWFKVECVGWTGMDLWTIIHFSLIFSPPHFFVVFTLKNDISEHAWRTFSVWRVFPLWGWERASSAYVTKLANAGLLGTPIKERESFE